MSLQNQLNNFRNGNNFSLQFVFNECKVSLFYVAYNYLKDKEKAQDVVQEVFLKLLQMDTHQRLQSLPETTDELNRLLYIITKNKALDELKTSKNRLQLLNNYFSFKSSASATNELFTHEVLSLILQRMPKRESEILKLHIDGFKNEEIAETLKISYNTVRNTLSEGRKKAQQYWIYFNK